MKQQLTENDYRRLSHRLAQGLDVWVKGYHVVAVALPDEMMFACENCALERHCDVDITNLCGEVDARLGHRCTLKVIDDDDPARLA